MSTFSRMEEQKRALLDELSRWTPERLAFQPRAGEWSALQMLDHLIRTEREILLVVYKNEHQLHEYGIIDRLRNRMLVALFRTKSKVKVPKTASLVLPGELTELPILSAEWHSIRATLAGNIDRLIHDSFGKAMFRHPVAGWMSMQAVLDFLSVHLVHHGFQLDRIRAASAHLQGERAM